MAAGITFGQTVTRSIHVPHGQVKLAGDLAISIHARGVVLFVHGSGSSRQSPRNKAVAEYLNEGGLATLLFDLLTPQEETLDIQTAEMRFDIPLLASRVDTVIDWLGRDSEAGGMPIGLFGASTGAAAALVAAAQRPKEVAAVVSRGGRPDLAGEALAQVSAPTLLIVGGADLPVLDLNEQALLCLRCIKEMRVVPGATHLFEQPGALEAVSRIARQWFERYAVMDRPEAIG